MDFFGTGISGYRKGFQRPTPLRWIEIDSKRIDSDSPGDEESKYTIRISLAQSSAKLRGLQGKTCLNGSFCGVFDILTIAR
jgi:hypothetical protein